MPLTPGALPDPAPEADSGLTFNERLAGLVPIGIVGVLVLAALTWRAERFSAASGSPATTRSSPLHLSPYFAAVLVISAGAALLARWCARASARAVGGDW